MDDRRIARAIGVAVVLIILVMVLRPLCAPEVVVPPDANQGAMKVAEDAVALARDANEEAAALRESVNTWFFFSLVLGVMIPVVVAFLLFRYWSQVPVEDVEVFQELSRLEELDAKRLPEPRRESLAEPPEEGESVHS